MSNAMLVCPGCRTRVGARLDVRTLEPAGAAMLGCECGRRYPIVDGIPLVLADPGSFYQEHLAAILDRDVPLELAAQLAAAGPDGGAYPALLEHVSIYVDAHWGDRAAPPPDGPAAELTPAYALAPLVEKVAERAAAPVQHAVELGCSVGRIVAALASGAERVVGLDLRLETLRRARRVLAGEPLDYLRRQIGRHYRPARIESAPLALAADRVLLVCGDALDPPLIPGWFDRVVAFNLFDSIAQPRQLLAVIDGLCAPGGEILLACPYQWQSASMVDSERFGGPDPAHDLVEFLKRGDGLSAPYELCDEAELAWTLRRDSRAAITYRTHYLRARKGNPPSAGSV